LKNRRYILSSYFVQLYLSIVNNSLMKIFLEFLQIFQCNIHNTVRKYTKDHVQINQQCKLTRNLPCLMFLLKTFLELKIYFNIFICHSSKETSQNWALGILSGSITFIPFTCRMQTGHFCSPGLCMCVYHVNVIKMCLSIKSVIASDYTSCTSWWWNKSRFCEIECVLILIQFNYYLWIRVSSLQYLNINYYNLFFFRNSWEF
jgi:hypothetical protein